ncbi:MAG: DUF3788 domain-containing protein [Lachnospiraceae bacterium]|nr:DUF3788 domain-containing protein [Lachnospiraceae bacterium]
MYERMLNKQVVPTVAEMTSYCAENAERFSMINAWLATTYSTEQRVVFPYGNKYGWGIGHYKKKKLMCNIFAEAGAFTVMMRLTNTQYEAIYDSLKKYVQEHIDNKYPCSDGGWIQYRVKCQEHYEDILKLLEVKCL